MIDSSFEDSTSKLFVKILGLGVIGFTITLLIQLVTNNYEEVVYNLLFGFALIISYILVRRGNYKLAQHIFILSYLLITVSIIKIFDHHYYAILLVPAGAMIFAFIFFDNRATLWGYFILLLLFEAFFLSVAMQVDYYSLPAEFFPELINVVAYMFATFFMGNFFLKRIRRIQTDLDIAKMDVQKQRKELSEKNDKLQKYIESNMQLENFAHLAAHELKSPLKVVHGFAKYLQPKLKGQISDEDHNMLSIINESSGKMDGLISALNDLGSVSQTKIEPQEIQIESLLNEILVDRRDQVNERTAKVKLEVISPILFADLTLIKQLLSNLIGNAIKFVPAERKPEVLIRVTEELGYNNITITDNGIGIPKEHRDTIFQLFNRAHTQQTFSGSGIGLAIAKKITDLHRGTIWVEDNSPSGSIFTVRIPIVDQSKS